MNKLKNITTPQASDKVPLNLSDKWYNIGEMAVTLNCSRSTVKRLLKKHIDIVAFTNGRSKLFSANDVTKLYNYFIKVA